MSAILPADVARCHGVRDFSDGDWREGCEDCRRRTDPPHHQRQTWTDAPKLVVFECELRIEPVESK